MKVLFLLLGNSTVASSRVRGYWVAEELEALGIHCRITSGFNLLSLLKCACLIPFYDCLVLQKRYSKWDYYLLKIAVMLRKKTIVDLDDKYSSKDNEITLKNLARLMKSAYGVTVGSKALMGFVKPYQANSHLLPTSVKLDNYQPVADKPSDTSIVLGWIGNGRHYHEDLINSLKEPLQQVALENDITLKLVGVCGQQDLYDVFDSIPGLKTCFIDALDWADESEIQKAIADFDVGLYPLRDNDFNRYKCGFKALEYMALGIPVISSRVGANIDIISDGVDGILIDDKTTWRMAISALVQDRERRLLMGAAGRAKVMNNYNVKNHALTLSEIIQATN